jgi:hypothetical protein
MNALGAAWRETVASALEAHAVAVAQMAPGHWTFALAQSPALAPAGARTPHVSARVAEDWLLFDAPLADQAVPATAWDVCAANAGLAGHVKFCAAPQLRLRAELPLFEDAPVGQYVQDVCRGLATAAAWWETPRHDEAADTPAVATADIQAADIDLPQLCRDAQWPFTLRGSDTVMVALDVPGGFQQAAIEVESRRGVVVSVPVIADLPHSPVCAAAVSRFLLRVTEAVRLVRVAIAAGHQPVSFEVVFTHGPLAEDLTHALAALSVAWRVAGPEVKLLAHDARVAQFYLDRAPPYPGMISGRIIQQLNNQQPGS